jgi:hypothetical protein
VHPNTVRRLIRTGRIRAQLVRGRHGDTWLVDASELDGALGRTAQTASTAGSRGVAPENAWVDGSAGAAVLPSAIDLSLDRARALERYTHGLLQPVIDLLREREAALERRDAQLLAQAERIGRLEREVELLRAERARTMMAAPAAVAVPPSPAAARAEVIDDLPEHVSTLAGQVGRLRAELQLIAAALRSDEPDSVAAREDGSAAPTAVADEIGMPAGAPPEVTPMATPEVTAGTPPAGEASPAAAAPLVAVTPEELAGLFPSIGRGRLRLEPLAAQQPTRQPAAHQAEAASPAAAADPFASAEAAVDELRRALAPDSAAPAAAGAPVRAEPSAGADAGPPKTADSRGRGAARRWWWPW